MFRRMQSGTHQRMRLSQPEQAGSCSHLAKFRPNHRQLGSYWLINAYSQDTDRYVVLSSVSKRVFARYECLRLISCFYHLVSKTRNLRSSSHWAAAFSLPSRNVLQLPAGFSAPRSWPRHGAAVAVNLSSSAQRLLPGRKLCSMPVRAICLSSA